MESKSEDIGNLCITLKEGKRSTEYVVIDDKIKISLSKVKSNTQVGISIKAPRNIKIDRKKIIHDESGTKASNS